MSTAKTCAKFGLDTVLVERKEYPSKPYCINCWSAQKILSYIKIDKKFVDAPITTLEDIFQDGTSLRTHDKIFDFGYILNRKTFDREILNLAIRDGAEFMNKTRITGLIRKEGKINGVKAKVDEREDIEIEAPIVIGADGVESKVGRWAGIYKRTFDINNVFIMIDVLLNIGDVDMSEEEYHTVYEYIGWKDRPNTMYGICPKGKMKKVIG